MKIGEVRMKASVRGRVIMLLENNPYPADSRVFLEAKALITAGYHVSVICPRAPGQPLFEILDRVSVYRYLAPPAANSFLGYIWEYGYSTVAACLLSLLVWWREGCDIIHAHNPPDTFVFIAAF